MAKKVTDSSAILEPSVRAFLDWTPQLVRAAELIADSGTLRAAADLADQMMADDRLLAVLNKRVHGVLGLPITFEAAKGRKRPAKALEAGEDWWSMFPEEDLGDLMKWGFLLGVGFAKSVWVEDPESGRLLAKPEVWHPRSFRWDPNRRAWFARVLSGEEIEVTPGDGTWIVFTPFGERRPWAKGLWRALAKWWLLKQFAINDWGKYSETHGQGMLVGQSTGAGAQGTGREDRQKLASDLSARGRSTVVVTPPGYELKLLEAMSNNYATFREQKSAADMAYGVTVLGQNLSTEVTGGSLAATDTHRDVEQDVRRYTAQTIASCTHDQVLTWWAEFNFGNRSVAPWPTWAVEPPEDLEALATLWGLLGAILEWCAQKKIPIDLDAFFERFAFPLKAGAALPDVLEPAPAPVLGGPPGDKPPPKPPLKALKAANMPATPGSNDGQAYVDKVAASGCEHGADALKPDVNAVLDAIKSGESFDDIKGRLLESFRSMGPDKTAKVMRATQVLSDLAGRLAIKQDAEAG